MDWVPYAYGGSDTTHESVFNTYQPFTSELVDGVDASHPAVQVFLDLVLGLWRKAAPGSIEAFMQLARGSLAPAPGDAPAPGL